MTNLQPKLRESIRARRPTREVDDEEIPTLDGFEVFRGEELLCEIHATYGKVPGKDRIEGNFLADGAHWRQLGQAIEGRRRQLRSGLDALLALIGERILPGLDLIVIRVPPSTLTPELIARTLEASGDVRLHRQLALDRPAAIRVFPARIRLLPVVPIAGVFACRFAASVDGVEVDGAIVIDGDLDPLPVVIDARCAETTEWVWPLALLGFAALTCPVRVMRREGGQSVASHPRTPPQGRFATERRLPSAKSLFSESLSLMGDHPHASHFVAGHRRRLDVGRQASDAAIDLALAYGIKLHSHETWVRPHARGIGATEELEFDWAAPSELGAVLNRRQGEALTERTIAR